MTFWITLAAFLLLIVLAEALRPKPTRQTSIIGLEETAVRPASSDAILRVLRRDREQIKKVLEGVPTIQTLPRPGDRHWLARDPLPSEIE